ncbi:MAG: radical SAM protein [Crenarchaeota archaeon]|nr:radical SAM protein [Thermoproteota archaeon]
MSFKIDEWIVKLDENTRPKTIIVEPSLECNFSCPYCFRRTFYENIRRRFLDIELFKKISEECYRENIRKIVFTGFGEPTLNPYFHDMLDISFRKFDKVVLNTNGSKIHEFEREILRNLDKLELVVSIHGEDTFNIVEDLMKKVQETGRKIHTRAIVVISRSSYDSLIEILDRCLKYFSIIIITNIIPIDERSLKDSCIDDQLCENNVRNVLAKYGFKFMFSGSCVKSVDFKLRTSIFECPFIDSKAIFIRSDGLVSPCMFMSHGWKLYLQGIERTVTPVIYGDVSENTIVDIWRSPIYAKFRFLVKMRQFPSCLDCDLVQYCTFTLSNEHDCWGNSPSCAFCPFARKLAYCPT